ncbi:hypothetical protein DFH11DRAFT_224334 [Phellopilus nigrolimitatus]|nr:hypothetical protein DFH11DRAFT_224334 [Phellopilus nigrolimitatus]
MGNGSRGTSSRAGSMLPPPPPPPRVPLITPSASPPVQRPFGRRSDGPSPTKRSRMSRTPSLLESGARGHSIGSTSSSSAPSPAFALDSRPEQGDDLQDARRLSMFRVLNVWSQLAGKYARRLDEDDIVDLEKETIIKDYGVLSSSDDMFEIGCFADLHEREERLDEEEQALQAVDDEPDEIDAFADTAENAARSETDGDGEDKWDFSRHLEPLPPVRELDPADAADLAEFLEAERARKDAFGDPDEDEDGSGKEEKGKDGGQGGGRDDGEEDTVGSRSGTEPGDIDNHSGVSEEEEVGEVYEESVLDEEDTNERNNERVDYGRLSTPSGSPEFDILGEFSEDNEEANEVVAVSEHAEEDEESFLHVSAEDPLLPAPDDDSEDELGVWEQDEGNTLYSVDDFSDGLVEEDDDHDNAAERTPTPSPTPETSPRPSRMRGRGRPLKQVADVDQGIRASSKAASRTKASDPSTFAAAVGQLQTPPRSSSSFGPEPRNGKPIATYSRKRQGKTPLRKKTPFRITSTASEDSQTEDENVTPSVPLTSQQKQEEEGEFQSRFRRSSASPMKRFKLIPEVVIDVPPPAMSKEASDAETKPVIGFIDLSEDPDDFPPPKSAKAKGKAKAVDDQDHVMRREIRPMPSRLPVRPRPNRSFQDKPLESLSKSFHNNRKRRRSSSMQILEEYDEIGDQEDAPFYSPPPAPSSSRHPSFSQLAADEEDNSRGMYNVLSVLRLLAKSSRLQASEKQGPVQRLRADIVIVLAPLGMASLQTPNQDLLLRTCALTHFRFHPHILPHRSPKTILSVTHLFHFPISKIQMHSTI